MDINTLRLALALLVSLGLHAAWVWWQPPRALISGEDQPLSLQVSLLDTAPSQHAPSALPPPAPSAQPEPMPEPTPSSEPEPVTPEQPELVAQAQPTLEPSTQAPPEPEAQAEPEPQPSAQIPSEPRPEPAIQPEPTPEPRVPPSPEPSPEPTAQPEPTIPAPPEPTARPQPEPPSAATQDNAANTTTSRQPSAADWTPAQVLHNPEPRYPRQARRRGLQGEVVLEVQILANGQPGDIDIVAGSGHALLDQAALAALRGWRFQPARQGGRAVSATLHVPVRFELR